MTIACAPAASVLRPWPVSNTRARAASLAGTSSTRPPLASSRCASGRPIPCPPSTAQMRSGHRRAACSSWRQLRASVPNRPVARKISRQSPASIVTGSLSGSTPMITLSTRRTSSPRAAHLASRGRATLFRAGQTLLQPHPATAPGHDAHQKRTTPNTAGGQPQESDPAGHLTPACASPGRSWKTQIAADSAVHWSLVISAAEGSSACHLLPTRVVGVFRPRQSAGRSRNRAWTDG
jgi:hypothetical protein